MLIKNKNLPNALKSHEVALPKTSSEIQTQAMLEIQRANETASKIRKEADSILLQSQKKLSEAEARVQSILRNADLQAKEIKERVYQETLHAANVEATRIKEEARQLLNELFQVKRDALTQAHREIIKVALDLAEKVIRYKAAIDPNVLKAQVIDAIKRATAEADRVQVFVNPSDLNILRKYVPEIERLFPSGIEIIPLTKDSVDQGSCIVETRSGQLDASFTTQLKTLFSLIERIEVIEPEIKLEEKPPIPSREITQELPKALIKEEPKTENKIETQEIIQPDEEETLTKELLGEEEIFDIIEKQDETPFVSSVLDEENEIVNVPPKRKINVSDLYSADVDDEDEFPVQEIKDELDEQEEEIKQKNILKPKKSQSKSDISNIASELEKSPEWKDLLQGENDEE